MPKKKFGKKEWNELMHLVKSVPLDDPHDVELVQKYIVLIDKMLQ